MFKIFGVGEEKDEVENIKISDEQIKEENSSANDVGQIALDVLETNYEVIIVAPIAGIDLDDIDITLNNSVLTISGERQKPENVYDSDIIIRNSECFWGKFIRNIILPENLDFDSVNAVMENNLLVIKILKLKFNTKEIKIDRIEG